jgi:DNA-binding response OmpR family regulator
MSYGLADEVEIVQYPDESSRIADLRRDRVPRLLLVAAGAAAPVAIGVEEDWIREPADAADIDARLVGLLARIGRTNGHAVPILDDTILRVGDKWVALSPIQARIVGALLSRKNTVVGRDALARLAWPEQADRSGASTLNVHVSNLRRRLEEVGLVITTVRSRGYLLQVQDESSQPVGSVHSAN